MIEANTEVETLVENENTVSSHETITLRLPKNLVDIARKTSMENNIKLADYFALALRVFGNLPSYALKDELSTLPQKKGGRKIKSK